MWPGAQVSLQVSLLEVHGIHFWGVCNRSEWQDALGRHQNRW